LSRNATFADLPRLIEIVDEKPLVETIIRVCFRGWKQRMDLFKAIETRKSIRKYKKKAISENHLGRILEAARLAPSAANKQPWRFVVVQNEKQRAKLAEAANSQEFLRDAAAIVVAAADPEVSASWHEKDTMIALEHMALAAAALGYGTCWIGAFDAEEIKNLLKIPEKMKIVALLPIGVPDQKPKAKSRKDFHEIFYKEKWQKPFVLKEHHPRIER
jgi:nitroreductase